MKTFIFRGSVQQAKGQGKTRDVSNITRYYLQYKCNVLLYVL